MSDDVTPLDRDEIAHAAALMLDLVTAAKDPELTEAWLQFWLRLVVVKPA